jgi:hypothetical protein
MSLKQNVNKLHSDLSNKYQVEIQEKFDRYFGNYIFLSIKEGNLNLVAKISKKNLESNEFDWIYLSNPEEDNSVVERNSSVESFISDVVDIFEKKRFDSDYLKKLN